MLRRLGRFVLYHLSPDAGSGAVTPASITYCSTRAAEVVASSERVAGADGEAVESRALDISSGRSARGAGFGSALAALSAGVARGFVDVGRLADRRRVAAALERLDPGDREVLELSLRRWVADDVGASSCRLAVPEFARRRARAVERLLGDLGVEGDEELGRVLEALLDSKTWVRLEAAGKSVGGRHPRLGVPPRLLRAPHSVAPGSAEAPGARARTTWRRQRGDGLAQRGASFEPRPVPGTEIVAAARPREGGRVRARSARHRVTAVGVVVAAVLATSALLAAARFSGGAQGSGRTADRSSASGPFVPRRVAPVGAPFPSDPGSASRYPTASITRATVLYDRPGGRPKVRIPSRTEWGSPRVLSVLDQQGSWLGVLAPELENNQVGWLRADRARIDAVTYALHADLSRRQLTVRHGGRVVRRMPVAIGAHLTSTPTGRFAVTDKLDVTDESTPYGCCVLVLTAHQTKLPRDWPGGDRLAVHSTRDLKAIGHAVSLGCMRATFRQARWLMKTIPLGTPVFVRR